MSSIPVLVLFGPTASGKTAILDRLFSAGASIPAEIVSADSMQIYRGMDIGTAKPDSSLLARLPHHLVDIRNPDESFNAGDFVRLADEACLDIHRRGKLPVVAGGTGFYLRNFVLGLPETPVADLAIREEVQKELVSRGAEHLMEELRKVDPESAGRIHINDTYRICRALEVYRSSGKPLSAFRTNSAEQGPATTARPSYRFLCVSLEREREKLYRRINERTSRMIEQGLAAEVSRLRKAGYTADSPGMRAIGYQEFFLCEEAEVPRKLPYIEELIARNSRHYAKRQIVFASSLPGLERIRMDDPSISAPELLSGLLARSGIAGV